MNKLELKINIKKNRKKLKKKININIYRWKRYIMYNI